MIDPRLPALLGNGIGDKLYFNGITEDMTAHENDDEHAHLVLFLELP